MKRKLTNVIEVDFSGLRRYQKNAVRSILRPSQSAAKQWTGGRSLLTAIERVAAAARVERERNRRRFEEPPPVRS